MLRKSRSSRGFTLAEVLVSVALIAILASVVVPTVRSRMQDGYENALIQEFTSLALGVNSYRQDVGKYPPSLNYLTVLPANPKDFCGSLLTATDIGKWRGPYVSRNIPASVYVILQADTVQPALARPGTAPAILQIQIQGPDLQTAQNIDMKIDGISNRLAGSLQYSLNGQTQLVSYSVPTRAYAC